MSTVMRDLKAAITTGFAAHLAALADFNGTTRPEWKVTVTYGYEHHTRDTERVFMGKGAVDTEPAAMRAGKNFRDETGRFDVVILASAVGGNARDADDRAYAIAGQFEDWMALRKGNELGVSGLQWVVTDGYTQATLGNDRGHMTELAIGVRYRARLT